MSAQNVLQIFLCFQSFLIFLSVTNHFTHGCGVITHTIIVERAKYSFQESSRYRKLMEIHQDAFYGGAPYPDSFYDDICFKGIYHGVSEDTHWGEFLNATINYINKQPKPWDVATEKLFVFMMAFMSHQVADITWHSLYLDQGFLPTMGYMNFHGSYSEAHPVGDFGGDVWNAYTMLSKDDTLYPEKYWYVPVDDLYNIYREFYGQTRIDKDVITLCSSQLLLEGIAEVLLGAEAFLTIANDSNFLIDNMMEYFQGGLMDMASLTTRKWNDAITMIEKGTRACDVPHSTVFINCSKSTVKTRYRSQKINKLSFRKPRLYGLTTEDLIITPVLRGVKVQMTEKLKSKVAESQKKSSYLHRKYSADLYPAHARQPNFTIDFRSSRSYSQLGWSVVAKDLDSDGNEDLVIGSPGHSDSNEPQRGRVYILYSGSRGLETGGHPYVDIDDKTLGYNRILEGNSGEYSRFGYAVAVLDVNLDGNMDIAVSASSLSYKGLLDYNLQFCNLGSSLTSIDLNSDGKDDLLIGSPFASVKNRTQNGMVTALLSSKSLVSGTVIPAEKLLQNWMLFGNQSYSWFGSKLTTKKDKLMVSQPFFRICSSCENYSPTDVQSVGKLSIYSTGQSMPTSPGLTITGRRRLEMAGYSSDIGDPFGNGSFVVAVGLPGMDVEGRTYASSENFVQGGGVLLVNSDMQEIAFYTGDRMFSRFGSVVKFSDINGDGIEDLLISASFRNDNPNILINSRINGKVYVFYGGRNFRMNNATVIPDCGIISPCPAEVANQTLGSGLDFKTDFGHTVTVLRAKEQIQVIISAPRNGDGVKSDVKQSGNVYVYNTKVES
ncbi:phosphatidylinositol-glycan-specific phospholipase D-like isoform X2 [Ostrea edulis]|uniref:phosphatidylinositol-glycan-specific phospholipase D-like isoform X2 n=1 Tax=Ostrea edulis TaxID=37623 RepID=UPI0024AF79AB|nr:phosphatidylinositol-glycan-specific phospholipase D-like isoform X2 [Ostrea edulis]